MGKIIKSVLIQWIPLAVIIIGICGLLYLIPQQVLRQGANDPQIQQAEDAAVALAKGASPKTLVPLEKSDVATSLIPFRMVLDETGHPIAWSGEINNLPPELPPGVLEFVRQNGEDRITWQPAPGVRLAAVIVKAGGSHPGFIVAARSLREVEKREDQVLLLAGLGMLVTLFLSLIAVIVTKLIFRNND
jgi:hypothetical protein